MYGIEHIQTQMARMLDISPRGDPAMSKHQSQHIKTYIP